ncbi:MAG: IS5 family transposase [Deferribacterales bacterium]
MHINTEQQKFAMALCEHRIRSNNKKGKFLTYMLETINWDKISEILETHYEKGKSKEGRKSYPALVLFKMLLLGIWYDLADRDIEEECRDSLSFSKFIGIALEDGLPDHTTLSRFRKSMMKSGCLDMVLDEVNHQLDALGIRINIGSIRIVDASITKTERKPKGKKVYELEEDREDRKTEEGHNEDEKKEVVDTREEKEEKKEKEEDKVIEEKDRKGKEIKLSDKYLRGVDTEAAWYKKGEEFGYGYKRHIMTDGLGLIISVHTTPANQHDGKHLKDIVEKSKIKEGSMVIADKGYSSEENRRYLRDRGIKDKIMRKFGKNAEENNRIRLENKILSKYRYVIERTFGSIKKWFNGGICRYVGLTKTHLQHVLEAIAYNLYRLPNLIVNNKERRGSIMLEK